MAKNLTMHPAPVYVATFRDGTVARMSYWQPLNKPLRQDAGRGLVCQAIGNERGAKAVIESRRQLGEEVDRLHAEACKEYGTSWRWRRYEAAQQRLQRLDFCTVGLPPAADIIAGHTERKDTGEIIPDPFFEESTVAPLAKPARKPATKAQLDRAVALLAELESRFGSQFPNAFGETQEFLLERMAA